MGSLFTVREWWAATPGASEEFGAGCVAVGNLDNASDGSLKIATGSFSGMLRLYYPRERDYRVEDLMLESQLDAPILQLSCGQLLSDSNRVALAVLHPRSIAVYSISAVAGSAGSKDASYFKVGKAYEHALERPSCNMVHGVFGGSYGHEQICVQSMDGTLTIVEQERIVLERKLSKFLLPGPLYYCAKSDFMLTYTARMEVECYKYASIVANPASASAAGSKGKLLADWSVIVGEEVVSIEVGRLSKGLPSSQVDILVVGSRTLLALRESGQVRTQKRLEFAPMCSTTYPSRSREAGGVEEHLLLGSVSGVLFIYKDLELLWSARLAAPALALRVATFGSQAGLVLSLSSDGACGLSYLGTDPPTSSVASEAKELNYEAMDEEHRRLLQVIRDSSSEHKPEPTDGLTLRAQVPPTCDGPDAEDASVVSTLIVRVFVSYSGASTLENVTLVASATLPLFLTADTVVLPSLAGGNRTPTIVPFTFRARAHELPVSLAATVIATYATPSGEPRCARCDIQLPLVMVAEPIPPIKQSQFKITLETNRPPPPIASLFEELLAKEPRLLEELNSQGGNALSLRYQCGLDATVLVSRNSGRFRVQSATFEGLWLLADELVRRLTSHHANRAPSNEPEPYVISFGEPLPLQEYFGLIDEHLACRIALDAHNEQLANRAQQFRVIEKRLLVRLKDRNPAPMQNLELLFDGTYHQLLQLADATEAAQVALAFHSARLHAGTRLILLLLRLRFALTAEEADVLGAHLSPHVEETTDLGWEERTDAAVTHLLKTALSKDGGRESRSSSSTALPARPADATKLKKHITLVADRLHKGIRPNRGQTEQTGAAGAAESRPIAPSAEGGAEAGAAS